MHDPCAVLITLNQWFSKQSKCLTNVRTFAQILMIGEFYGLCQSVIEFVNWTQIINKNWNTSGVSLWKDARVNSLIHKYMREGYMWMIRYIISYKLRQENKVVLWEVIWRTGIIFLKKLALLPNSFWNSPPFYYEMAFFPWCFMCKRTWTLVFGNFLRVHNA